jgi:endonuclease/exonuclease/phosphatase family metal-dependent hydrolase
MRLRLVTLNVWALPWPVGHDVALRMEAIGKRLPRLEADVIALQEVWTRGARNALATAGRRAGLPHVWHNEAATGGSGLLVLSRLPVQRTGFEAYHLGGRPERIWEGDYQGGKGFALLEIETPGGPVTLVDTHLHAQYTDDAQDGSFPYRVGQVVQLATRLAPIRQPILAVGDFNLREDRPEYRILTGLSRLSDAAVALDHRQDTVRPETASRGRGTLPGARIDYVFTRNGAQRRAVPHSIEQTFDDAIILRDEEHGFSDHIGLLAEIDLVPGDTAPAGVDPVAATEARRILETGRDTARSRRTGMRALAGGTLAGAAGGLLLAPHVPLSRRRLLRGAALISLPVGLGAVALAESFGAREIRAFDTVLAELEGLQGRG